MIELLLRKDDLRLLKLCKPVKPMRYVYFPTESFNSSIAQIEGSSGVEVGMVAHNDMLGAQLVLGVVTAHLYALVQGAGVAWRIGNKAFQTKLETSPALWRVRTYG